ELLRSPGRDPLRHRAEPSWRAGHGHLLAALEGQDHLPRHPRGRPGRERHHGAAFAPRERGPGAGHQPVHKLAGRFRHGRPRDLRHHALRQAGHRYHGPRHGRLDGCLPARGGCEGQEERASEHQDPPSPAERRRARRAGLRRGDPRQGARPHQAAPQRDPGREHRTGLRQDRARHRPRLHNGPRGGHRVRRHRHHHQEPL
ncbi:MAG: ATP-dependent Clp protease proteolytic subunit, partial [uncultured Rubrobacteraceae bacterium]